MKSEICDLLILTFSLSNSWGISKLYPASLALILVLSSILWLGGTTICLTIHLLKGISVASCFLAVINCFEHLCTGFCVNINQFYQRCGLQIFFSVCSLSLHRLNKAFCRISFCLIEVQFNIFLHVIFKNFSPSTRS